MISEENIMLIRKYLDGDLSSDEKELFNEKRSSKDFNDELKFQEELIKHLSAQISSERKAIMLEDFRRVRKNQKKSTKSSKQIYYYIAAAVSLLIISFSTIQLLKTKSNEQIFESYFIPYDGVTIKRGQEDQLSQGMKAYSNGDYNEALIFFQDNAIGTTEPENFLLIGNCHLALNEAEKSLIWFNKISRTENKIAYSAALWYKSLAYIKLEEVEKSRHLLEELVQSNSIYEPKASQLLKESIFEN
ncbi:hypothetical protein [Ekhidna sp.]|uniref:tetratricopeptide repeat protein n=1 Tax=Ekhidna sp. TaxID=2608089 RepID=UPI00329A3D74